MLCPNVRMNIEAFHLADVVVDRSQRDATHRQVIVPGQQQAASWRRVLPRQGDEFGLEFLETKVDPQTFGVPAEQHANDRQVFRQVSGSDVEHAVASRDRALWAAAGNPDNGVSCCKVIAPSGPHGEAQFAGTVNDSVIVTTFPVKSPRAPTPTPNCANACHTRLQSVGVEPFATEARMPSRMFSYAGFDGVKFIPSIT